MKQLLIDGNSLFYRCYYASANNGNMSANGVPTNAVYSFAIMLRKAVSMIHPDRIIVAFDKGKKTWRHKVYQGYKEGRKETPEDLIVQRPIVKEFLDSANIQWLESDEYEADDIVGSIAKQTEKEYESIVLTSDKDLLQLSDEKITVYLMKTGLSDFQSCTPEFIKEKYGYTPRQVPDYKGLCGDTSDNIKGVQGIGEKTALKLLQEYDSIEGIYSHVDDMKGALKTKLEDGIQEAFFSKALATITQYAKVEIQDKKYDLYSQKARDFYWKYNMKTLL